MGLSDEWQENRENKEDKEDKENIMRFRRDRGSGMQRMIGRFDQAIKRRRRSSAA
jgi:hypothetical protein